MAMISRKSLGESETKSIRACTLFDSNFILQGLALIESVEQNSLCDVRWTILALDKSTVHILESLGRTNIEVIYVEDFMDPELLSLKSTRPWNQFCWTSAACLLNFCLSISEPGQIVAYLDADCYFFGDIDKLLLPLLNGYEIAIHEHRFSNDRLIWLNKSGRFNVGLVAGINDRQFRMCVSRWRGQVLERCDVNHLEGRCGDQTYLNEWPNLFPSLYILEEPGAGLAPWNIKNYRISTKNHIIEVDSRPLYFYHFSSLEFIYFSKTLAVFIPADGYLNMDRKERVIYHSYVKQLMRLHNDIGKKPRTSLSLKSSIKHLLKRSISLQIRVG
jgi:hypothetical protein